MITWIIFGYLGISAVASAVFYAACVAAARADRVQQRLFTETSLPDRELQERRAERPATPRLALNA